MTWMPASVIISTLYESPCRMSKPGKSQPPKNFEDALKEMEGIVATMESGELSLDASLSAYQRGMELSAYCQKILADAEARIKILENGQLKDFDSAAEDAVSDE